MMYEDITSNVDAPLVEGLIAADLHVKPTYLIKDRYRTYDNPIQGLHRFGRAIGLTPKQIEGALTVYAALISWKSYKLPRKVIKVMTQNRNLIGSIFGDRYLSGG